MEAVWGAVLSFLFILATLSGYNVTGPWTSEQKEQIEKQLKEQKEEIEKQQKEKSENSQKKQKSEQPDKGSSSKASKKKSSSCIEDCSQEWRLRN
jgi:Tfp pilus assembly protein PilN